MLSSFSNKLFKTRMVHNQSIIWKLDFHPCTGPIHFVASFSKLEMLKCSTTQNLETGFYLFLHDTHACGSLFSLCLCPFLSLSLSLSHSHSYSYSHSYSISYSHSYSISYSHSYSHSHSHSYSHSHSLSSHKCGLNLNHPNLKPCL